MVYLKIKSMAQPPSGTDWTFVSIICGLGLMAMGVVFKLIDSMFATRGLKNDIADIKKDIDVLFKYREEDRNHLDRKFETVFRELKK